MNKGFYSFPKGINLKVIVIVCLELEIAYYDFKLPYVSHCTTGTPSPMIVINYEMLIIIINNIIIIIILPLENCSHQRWLIVFLWSLSDCKSPQVSRTLLGILADLNKVVVWSVSTCPLISNPPFSKHWGLSRVHQL